MAPTPPKPVKVPGKDEMERHWPKGPDGASIAGRVKLKLTVKPDGTVYAPVVVESSAPELREPALEIIRGMQFQPATRHDKPIEALIHYVLKYGDAT